jgi:hypothetical protein
MICGFAPVVIFGILSTQAADALLAEFFGSKLVATNHLLAAARSGLLISSGTGIWING